MQWACSSLAWRAMMEWEDMHEFHLILNCYPFVLTDLESNIMQACQHPVKHSRFASTEELMFPMAHINI